jgi:two-component system cell cycle sensor histidine kinase/response regulator CckA
LRELTIAGRSNERLQEGFAMKQENLFDSLVDRHAGDLNALIRDEQSILNGLSVPLFFVDSGGCLLGANTAFWDFLGRDGTGEHESEIYQCLAPRFTSEYQEIDRRVMAENRTLTFEGYAQDAGGEERRVVYKKTAVPNADGDVTGMVTVLYDLSDLRDIRTALMESEAQRQAILDGFSDIVVLFDRERKVVWANNSVRKICSSPIGRPCQDLFCRESDGCRNCGLVRTFQSGRSEAWMQRIEASENNINETFYDMISTPVSIKPGKVDSVVVIARDATEKLKLEKQLQYAMKMEAIGTLAGGIAHDFNNILTPIMGYSEIMKLHMTREGGSRKEIVGYIDGILKAARRARRLVEQILTFSRSSEQKESLQYIHPIIKEVMKLICTTLPSTVEIRQEIDEQCGLVVVDPVQIHQILINLCTNASDAMAGSSGLMTVRLAKSDRTKGDREWLELSVSDTGCGIDPAVRDRIFEPYFTTKEKGQGTGMGLAMVHGIISRQGGELEIESVLGKGTVFRIFLPVAKETSSFDQVVSMEDMPGGQERILLVDDEEQVVAVTGELLESLGYSVTGRTSAQESLLQFSKAPADFDVVITDLTMPYLTGLDLCRRMKAVRPDIPVILFTGYLEEFSADAAREAGIDAFFMKPVSFREMAKVVRKTLDDAHGLEGLVFPDL